MTSQPIARVSVSLGIAILLVAVAASAQNRFGPAATATPPAPDSTRQPEGKSGAGRAGLPGVPRRSLGRLPGPALPPADRRLG